MNNKFLVFDMDGTIADLYGTADWRHRLDVSDASVYTDAAPMIDMSVFTACLDTLRAMGYKVAILTWLSKNADPVFHENIRKAKSEWIKRYGIPADDVIMLDYGTDKSDAFCKRHPGSDAMLFDDDAKVRASWCGRVIDPVQYDINTVLGGLIRYNMNYNTEV